MKRRLEELSVKLSEVTKVPEIPAANPDYLLLPSSNTEASAHVTEKQIYELSDLEECEMIEDVGEDLVLFNDIWNEIRFGL